MNIKEIFFILAILIFFSWPNLTQAGFGISPPWIENERLVPGSHFEQIITLTRAEPKEPVEITVEIDDSEVKGWIKIKEGEKFIYPAGPQQFPMTVIVDVPESAGYGTYYGEMTIRAGPIGPKGQVTVAIGAVAKINLRVSGEKFSDFKIRQVSIPDFEETWPLRFVVELENLGNVKVRPSKVHLDIFHNFHQEKLFSGDILEMSWVDSFKVGQSIGEFNVDLKSGQYWAEYEIYKNDTLVLKEKLRFNIHLPGTLKPKPIFVRIKDFLVASPLRLILFTFLATLILIGLILGIIVLWKKYKK